MRGNLPNISLYLPRAHHGGRHLHAEKALRRLALARRKRAMSIWTTSDKYILRYGGGNSAATRRDTLVEGGPLIVKAAHFLVTALPHELEDVG